MAPSPSRSTWRSETDWTRISLTEPMQDALFESFVNEKGSRRLVLAATTGTRKALLKRGFCNPDGTLTPMGFIYSLSHEPLRVQCALSEIPLVEIDMGALQSLGRLSPELRALRWYEEQGASGCFTEGGIVLVVLYALCFQRLRRLAENRWGNIQAAFGHTGKQMTPVQSMMYGGLMAYRWFLDVEPNIEEAILEDIGKTCIDEMGRNVDELKSWQVNENWWPHHYVGITRDLALNVCEGLGRDCLVRIASLFFSEPYAYAKGWPDLTLIEDGKVRFAEVKTTDRLHPSQLITMPDMKRAASLDIFVLQIRSNKGNAGC